LSPKKRKEENMSKHNKKFNADDVFLDDPENAQKYRDRDACFRHYVKYNDEPDYDDYANQLLHDDLNDLEDLSED
jgi:hypothetical protein